MCPAIASGIVTEDALVGYWPMLLAIITICTRAQLHSKTISGFACVASVSVRFLSKESKTARTPPPSPAPASAHSFSFLALVSLFARPHGNACLLRRVYQSVITF